MYVGVGSKAPGARVHASNRGESAAVQVVGAGVKVEGALLDCAAEDWVDTSGGRALTLRRRHVVEGRCVHTAEDNVEA